MAHAPQLFGEQSIYIDIKKRIGDSVLTIPDGYLIDFSFEADPRLYIIENELAKHDAFDHIGVQLMKFALAYKASGRHIKRFLLEHLTNHPEAMQQVEEGLQRAGFRNVDAFLERIIFERPVAAIEVIDQSTPALENVLNLINMNIDVIEFQSFAAGDERIHKYTPFNAGLRSFRVSDGQALDPAELNTVVVSARQDGFEQEFLQNQCWYAIRIHASMLDRIKYIAAYQVAPVSAITHYAEVATIKKWNDTNKYILQFKGTARELTPAITLDKDKKGLAPQAPRYTAIDRLLKAKKLSDVF